jgi:hypothetical protein
MTVARGKVGLQLVVRVRIFESRPHLMPTADLVLGLRAAGLRDIHEKE